MIWALVAFTGTFLMGLLVIGPTAKKLPEIGPTTPEGQEVIRKIFSHLRMDLVFLFSIIFAMTVKPTFDDGWVVAIAALVIVALVGWLEYQSRSVKLAEAPPAPEAAARLGLELDEYRPADDAVAYLDVHGRHRGVEGRADRVLHLHRLEHHEALAGAHLVAGRDGDLEHGSRHGRHERALATRRAVVEGGVVDVRRRRRGDGGRFSRQPPRRGRR